MVLRLFICNIYDNITLNTITKDKKKKNTNVYIENEDCIIKALMAKYFQNAYLV